MGMTSKRTPIAMLKTFCFVKILPWFGVSLASGTLMLLVMTGLRAGSAATGFGAGSVVLSYSVVVQLLFIGVNLALIALARRRAQETFAKWANSAVV
jgi:hypothetical protein